MKNFFYRNTWLFLLLLACTAGAQTVPQGITYQGIARNSGGLIMVSQPVSVKLGIYAPTVSGTLQWEEVHTVTTNATGLFYFVIGQGTSTGAGSMTSFSAINWGAANHFVKISIDPSGGSSYVAVDTMQFWSVPYAMYAANAGSLGQPLRLNQLTDVDTIGVATGYVLKWNGSLWLPAPDLNSDTAMYASSAAHAANSDTASYAIHSLSTVDTVPYATNSGSSAFATSAGTATSASHSNHCDTATYALNTASTYNYWNVSGNSGISPTTNFIGTINNADLVFKTNNTEAMRISAAGRVGIGTTAPTATLHVVGDNGVVAEGTFGTGAVPPSGAGTRMVWYPKKGAFRAGTVSGTQWNDASIGVNSFAASSNTTASGAYATALGFGCIASGQYSLAACQSSNAVGLSSVSLGTACSATGAYSIAMGRQAQAVDTSAICMGYHNSASGKYALSIGYETVASGPYSTAMGFWSSTNSHTGSFVFADYSSASITNSTADNQFLVRASGGVYLYSNGGLTSGVTLPAGGGSWASVSDKHKKEHFHTEDADAILEKISNMEITSWNYKTQDAKIRHIGPMAQDFYAAFGFGESDTTITGVDIDGVNMIAVQALAKRTAELKAKADEVEQLKRKVAQLENEKQSLESRINGIERRLNEAPVGTTTASTK